MLQCLIFPSYRSLHCLVSLLPLPTTTTAGAECSQLRDGQHGDLPAKLPGGGNSHHGGTLCLTPHTFILQYFIIAQNYKIVIIVYHLYTQIFIILFVYDYKESQIFFLVLDKYISKYIKTFKLCSVHLSIKLANFG